MEPDVSDRFNSSLSDPSSDTAPTVILAIILIFIVVAGIIGNSTVILAIILSRKLRSTLNWFVLNLACADLFASLCLPFYVEDLFGEGGWRGHGTFPLNRTTIPRDLALYLINSSTVAESLSTHVFIAFTSWYLITQEVHKFKKLYSTRNICIMIACSWVINLSICHVSTFLPQATVFTIVLWISGHFVMAAILYIKIWRFVARSGKKMRSKKGQAAKTQGAVEKRPGGSSERPATSSDAVSYPEQSTTSVELGQTALESSNAPRSEDGQQPVPSGSPPASSAPQKKSGPKIDKRTIAVTKNLLIILIAFIICFFPYSIIISIRMPAVDVIPWLYTLLLFNSCINPIIYARRMPMFREVMVCILTCRLGAIPAPIECLRRLRHRD